MIWLSLPPKDSTCPSSIHRAKSQSIHTHTHMINSHYTLLTFQSCPLEQLLTYIISPFQFVSPISANNLSNCIDSNGWEMGEEELRMRIIHAGLILVVWWSVLWSLLQAIFSLIGLKVHCRVKWRYNVHVPVHNDQTYILSAFILPMFINSEGQLSCYI